MAIRRATTSSEGAAEHLLHLLETDTSNGEKRLQDWLDTRTPDDLIQTLTRIAFPTANKDSENEKAAALLTGFVFMPLFLASLAFFPSLSAAVGDELSLLLTVLFAISSLGAIRFLSRRWTDQFFGSSAAIRKRALLLLAERGHHRALQTLARQWNPWAKNNAERARINSPLETMLFLDAGHCRPPQQSALRSLFQRAFPTALREKADDFTASDADVLLAAMRCLATAGGPRNRQELVRLARFPVPNDAPNRALLRDMADLFLDNAKPVVRRQREANAAAPIVNPATIAPEREIITLQRRTP